jgi:hypothetical protein
MLLSNLISPKAYNKYKQGCHSDNEIYNGTCIGTCNATVKSVSSIISQLFSPYILLVLTILH